MNAIKQNISVCLFTISVISWISPVNENEIGKLHCLNPVNQIKSMLVLSLFFPFEFDKVSFKFVQYCHQPTI